MESMAYNGGGVSPISILNDKGDQTNPYGNGDADEVDETNVLIPDSFTQPIFNHCSWKDRLTATPIGIELGGSRESKDEITTPLGEYLNRFGGPKWTRSRSLSTEAVAGMFST